MNCNAIIASAKTTLSKTVFSVRKHSPEILMVTGVVGVITSAVMACKATTKASGIIEEAKSQVETVHDILERKDISEETYSVEDSKKDLAIIYAQTAVKFIKLYAPSVILGMTSLTAMITSNRILRNRNVALAAAYTTVDTAFKSYRKRVADRFGEEVEKEIRHNVKAMKIEEKTTDENGKEKTVKKTVKVADLAPYSPYAKIFDEYNPNWQKDPEYNLMFIKSVENYANDMLKSKRRLFLNEVYDMLGFEKTKAGQVVGWVYDPEDPVGDNYVDFGLYDIYTHNPREAERKSAFVNGYERSCILDFNVDGNIWEMM